MNEVAAAIRMPPRTIKLYISKVLNFGEVKVNTIGRPINSVSMHQHVEFLIMEAVLEHPEKTERNNLSSHDGNDSDKTIGLMRKNNRRPACAF